jgi:hypothetical protein
VSERPRKIVILQGDYTPEEIAKFLLHATSRGRDMPPDRNLAAAKKVLTKVSREGLYTNLKSQPATDDMMFLAALNIQRTLLAQGKPCSDHTAIVKLAGGRKGWCDTLLKKLKARRQTLEQIAAPYQGVLSVSPLSPSGKHQPKK